MVLLWWHGEVISQFFFLRLPSLFFFIFLFFYFSSFLLFFSSSLLFLLSFFPFLFFFSFFFFSFFFFPFFFFSFFFFSFFFFSFFLFFPTLRIPAPLCRLSDNNGIGTHPHCIGRRGNSRSCHSPAIRRKNVIPDARCIARVQLSTPDDDCPPLPAARCHVPYHQTPPVSSHTQPTQIGDLIASTNDP